MLSRISLCLTFPTLIFSFLLFSCKKPDDGPTVLWQEDFSEYDIDDPIDATKWMPYVTGGSIDGGIIKELTKALHLANPGYWVLYKEGTGWTNYTYSLEVKTTNLADQFGIYFRAQYGNPGPAYSVLLQGGNRIQLQSTTSGILEDITTGFAYTANEYHTLKVEVSGENIKVWFDNELVIDYIDIGTGITFGTVGLCAWAENEYFDNIRVTAP